MPVPGNSIIPDVAYWPGSPVGVSITELNIPFGALVIDNVTPALWQKTSTTDNSAFNQLSQANQLTAPVIAGGLTASGSASNNFSGSTGAFATSTGTTTISGPLVVSTQALSGAGAVNVTSVTTRFTSTGSAQALTLADGVNGQIKNIIHVVDGGSGVLTPTTKTGYSTITFTSAGDSAVLEFVTTQGWCVISLNGATTA